MAVTNPVHEIKDKLQQLNVAPARRMTDEEVAAALAPADERTKDEPAQ